MTRPTRLILASVFAFWVQATPAEADEFVQLERGDLVLSDQEFELITAELLILDPTLLGGFRVANDVYGPFWLMVGRFDMTDNGVEEWFVSIAHFSYCGTAGCTMFVMEFVDGKFSTLARNGLKWSGVDPGFEVHLRRGEDGKWFFPASEF